MSTNASANGADADQPRQRPSWYVPPKPVPDDYDGPSGRELLLQFANLIDPSDLPDELRQDLRTYLDRLLESDRSTRA